MELNVTVARVSGFVSVELDNEIVILQESTGKYLNVNAVGNRILTLCEQPVRVEQLYERLLNTYRVDPEICLSELLAFLDRLLSLELIRICEGADTDVAA